MAASEITRVSSLPPYPEMIYAALDALNEKLGSNKTSISNYIESRYGTLPAGHSTILRHHLNVMKETGQLIFWKNNYMKPDPNFIRRGRGRPPKPKDGTPARPKTASEGSDTAASEAHSGPPPPSSAAGETALAVPFKKKETRGRPRKYPRPEDLGGDGPGLALGSGPTSGPKKRGRPPKAKPGESGF